MKLNVIVLIVFENAIIDMTKIVLLISITSLFIFVVSTLLFVLLVFDIKIILKQLNLHQKYIIFFDIIIYDIDFTIKIITIVVKKNLIFNKTMISQYACFRKNKCLLIFNQTRKLRYSKYIY